MFSAMALHPAVKDLAQVRESDRTSLNEQMGALTFRLLGEDCLDKTQKAVKYEGGPAVQASFQVLGQVAAGELFSNPSVAQGLADLERYMHDDKLNELLGIK